jgi:putative membrane protein
MSAGFRGAGVLPTPARASSSSRRKEGKMRSCSCRNGDVRKGVLAGALGGLAGAWVMNQYWAAVGKAEQRISERFSANSHGQKQTARRDESQQQQAQERDEAGDATQKAANKLFRAVFHRALTAQEKQIAGPLVHYSFGKLMGAAYGGAVEIVPQIRSNFGAGFATVLFIGVDELAVPALGFAAWPRSVKELPKHAEAWGAHLVYGATTELIRRALRAVW